MGSSVEHVVEQVKHNVVASNGRSEALCSQTRVQAHGEDFHGVSTLHPEVICIDETRAQRGSRHPEVGTHQTIFIQTERDGQTHHVPRDIRDLLLCESE